MEVHFGLQMTSNKAVAVIGHIILDFPGNFSIQNIRIQLTHAQLPQAALSVFGFLTLLHIYMFLGSLFYRLMCGHSKRANEPNDKFELPSVVNIYPVIRRIWSTQVVNDIELIHSVKCCNVCVENFIVAQLIKNVHSCMKTRSSLPCL